MRTKPGRTRLRERNITWRSSTPRAGGSADGILSRQGRPTHRIAGTGPEGIGRGLHLRALEDRAFERAEERGEGAAAQGLGLVERKAGGPGGGAEGIAGA